MLDYLLKSGGCLLAFYLFYVLFLEKENMHVYKRIYLLLMTVVSFTIPLITFTNYVEIVEQLQPMITSGVVTEYPVMEEAEPKNYLQIFGWSIYGLGILLFGVKFIKNSYDIITKIKNNTKERNGETTSVLLKEDIVPHTFFNFIFFNKQKFNSHQIPKEVILHEQAHARQKHSIDVLLLELVQIICWFNPIIYLVKKAIKLNHEFLADQAVLNAGANTKTYQKTLLAYSSNTSQLPLANAINYSSIKKRFTVMKTHTSKRKIWIRSLVLLPVLALLLFSFSTTIQQEIATPKQVAEYNALAKQYNEQPINNRVIKYVEIKRMKILYDLMSSAQKSKAEKYPNIPPPPPPKMPKNVNYILDNKKVSYDEASKVKDEDIQSVEVITKDKYGKKLPKSVIYISTKKENKIIGQVDKNLFRNDLGENVRQTDWDYFVDNKKVSHKEFQSIDENDINSVNVVKRDRKGNKLKVPSIYVLTKLSNQRPIISINGKKSCDECVVEITKEKLSKVVLSVDKGEITKFLIKFPKKPTVRIINNNGLNKAAKKFLLEAKIGEMVQIFGLKSSAAKNHGAPILFKIIK